MDIIEEMFTDVDSNLGGQLKKGQIIEDTKVTMKDGIAKTETEIKNEQRAIDTKYLKLPHSYLNIRLATNVNIGNYQSCKVEKGLMIPIGAEADSTLLDKIKSTDQWASKILEGLVQKELAPIFASLKKREGK